MPQKLKISDQQWMDRLTPKQFRVLRQQGTEVAFSGELLHNEDAGTYRCAGCGGALFHSDHKYDSGTGWPSFFDVPDPKAVDLREDVTLGITRTEVSCAACGGHLGHLFPDGPEPTGQRYCINSVALAFEPDEG